MPTDEERREVAQNMRDSVKSKTECELLSINGSSAAIRWLISYVVFGDKKYHSGVDLMNRLADLIEPSDSAQTVAEDMFGQMRHSTEQERIAYADMMARNSVGLHTVDRDALLALAEDVDGAAEDSGGFESLAGMLHDIARCIREALGVVE